MAGPKLFQSFSSSNLSGCGECLPTNSTVVNLPRIPGLYQSAKLDPVSPNSPLLPPTGAAIIPLPSYGTPYHSQRTPRFSVRSGRTFQSSLKNQLNSF